MNIKTRHIALTGILLALSAVLINTPLGMIPVPTPAQYATIMHVPVIIIAILEGPVIGAIAGFIFGILAFLKVPAYGPIIHIIPRPLIGIIPALVYLGINGLLKNSAYSWKENLAISLAAVSGSLANTIGVLGFAVWLNIVPLSVAITIAATNGIFESIFAVVVTVPIVLALRKRFSLYYEKNLGKV